VQKTTAAGRILAGYSRYPRASARRDVLVLGTSSAGEHSTCGSALLKNRAISNPRAMAVGELASKRMRGWPVLVAVGGATAPAHFVLRLARGRKRPLRGACRPKSVADEIPRPAEAMFQR